MKTSRIDVHHHLLTPEYLEELASVGVVESGGIPFPSWTPEDSLGFLRSSGDSDDIALALLTRAVFWQSGQGTSSGARPQ